MSKRLIVVPAAFDETHLERDAYIAGYTAGREGLDELRKAVQALIDEVGAVTWHPVAQVLKVLRETDAT